VITLKPGARLALIALLVVQACGLGGGSRGTGVTSLAEGNVAVIQTASAGASGQWSLGEAAASAPAGGSGPAASPDVAGITVAVQPSGHQGVTDSTGAFFVPGNFESQLTLLFTRPRDAIRASMAIDIPAGGRLTLHDVTIDNSRGVAAAASQEVDFTGQIVQIDCGAGNLVMVSSQRVPADTDRYTVRLGTSTLRDTAGNPVTCSELILGQLGQVHGSVNADGSFGDAEIVVE